MLPAIPPIAVHSIFAESTGTFEDVSNCGTDQRRFLSRSRREIGMIPLLRTLCTNPTDYAHSATCGVPPPPVFNLLWPLRLPPVSLLPPRCAVRLPTVGHGRLLRW